MLIILDDNTRMELILGYLSILLLIICIGAVLLDPIEEKSADQEK